MEKSIYKYVAVFTQEESGMYGAEVPNFGEVYSQGYTLEEAIKNITDCLVLGIFGRKHDNEELPKPINQKDYAEKLEENQFFLDIEVDMSKATNIKYN